MAPPSKTRGCLLIALALAVFVVVGVLGLGLPYVYWYTMRDVQIFDGPEELVLFVDVYKAMRYPGLAQTNPLDKSARLIKITVTPQGAVELSPLQYHGGYITFNANLFTVLRFSDDFYLVENPLSTGRRLLRFNGDVIEPAARPDHDEILRSFGTADLSDRTKLDKINEENGWRRLNDDNGKGPYLVHGDSIISKRNRVRLRLETREGSESLIAESLSETNPWTKTLITIDTRRWRSYKAP